MLYRQGDVLIRKIQALPRGKRTVRENGILAYGEVTGHCHKIEGPSAEALEISNGLYLSVNESGVRIVHHEHDPIILPPGSYEISTQFEYTPAAIRTVAD